MPQEVRQDVPLGAVSKIPRLTVGANTATLLLSEGPTLN
jgi:hypothetical protein